MTPYAAAVASADPIIVCPLVFERDGLSRRGVHGRLVCTGPGSAGMKRLGELIGDPPSGPVILAGLSGGLDPSITSGSACIITEVIGADGSHHQPSWPPGIRDRPRITIVTNRNVLTNTDAKRALAAATGAYLVDQESEPFATLAADRGWTWGVLRAVSDDAGIELPTDIEQWVDAEGRTRYIRALASCVKRPKHLVGLVALRRNSIRGLDALAQLLKDFCT